MSVIQLQCTTLGNVRKPSKKTNRRALELFVHGFGQESDTLSSNFCCTVYYHENPKTYRRVPTVSGKNVRAACLQNKNVKYFWFPVNNVCMYIYIYIYIYTYFRSMWEQKYVLIVAI